MLPPGTQPDPQLELSRGADRTGIEPAHVEYEQELFLMQRYFGYLDPIVAAMTAL